MRRREVGMGAEAAVVGVIGIFRRTEEAWRSLGAPLSLYADTDAAVESFARVHPARARGMVATFGDPLPRKYRRFLAFGWQSEARPYFLRQLGVLSVQEQRWMARYPGLFAHSAPDEAALTAELFSHGRHVPVNRPRGAKERPGH